MVVWCCGGWFVGVCWFGGIASAGWLGSLAGFSFGVMLFLCMLFGGVCCCVVASVFRVSWVCVVLACCLQ